MFESALEEAMKYTSPIRTISRTYGSEDIQPGAATLIMVNDEGWALTCAHVVNLLKAADGINQKYGKFLEEIENRPSTVKLRKHTKALERKFDYKKTTTIQMKNRFSCVDRFDNFQIISHPTVDVALIKFNGFSKLSAANFPRFPKDTSGLTSGKYLCRLGFPFVEFTNFVYDKSNDDIQWTSTGKVESPFFPLEGMVTRQLASEGNIVGFEMSTPGLKGQSGGPAIDQDGVVWGMQSVTAHLDLKFDVDMEVVRNGQMKRIKDYAFLHVGHCVHVDVLKEFMTQNKVKFTEV